MVGEKVGKRKAYQFIGTALAALVVWAVVDVFAAKWLENRLEALGFFSLSWEDVYNCTKVLFNEISHLFLDYCAYMITFTFGILVGHGQARKIDQIMSPILHFLSEKISWLGVGHQKKYKDIIIRAIFNDPRKELVLENNSGTISIYTSIEKFENDLYPKKFKLTDIINSLVKDGLIEDKLGRGEVYTLTMAGMYYSNKNCIPNQ